MAEDDLSGSNKGPRLDPQSERKLREGLKQLGGRGTLGDVVRVTGLPMEQTEQDLRAMLGLYKSHLEVDDNGELLYLFDSSMVRRVPAPTLRDTLLQVARWSWKAFVVLFKVSMMLVLVGYVMLFCVLLVAAFIALLALTEGDIGWDAGAGEGAGCLSSILEMFIFWDVGDVVFIPLVIHDTVTAGHARGAQGIAGGVPSALSTPGELEPRYVTDTFQAKRSRQHHFHESIFAFVFGPTIPDPPTKAEDREILAWINAQRGVITMTELIIRTGMTVEKAQQEMTRLLVRYNGDVEVTEDGQLLYSFQGVRVSAYKQGKLEVTPAPAPPSWHRFEPDPQLTGNSAGSNAAIIAMISFIALMSIVSPVLMAILPWLLIFFPVVTLLPLLISLLFFTIPAARWFANSVEGDGRLRRNVRRAALLSIFEHLARTPDQALTRVKLQTMVRDALKELANPRGESDDEERRQQRGLKDVGVKIIDQEIQDLIRELEGEEDLDVDTARATLRFPGLLAEMRAADQARLRADAQSVGFGPAIFSTADEDDDPLRDTFDALEGEAERAHDPGARDELEAVLDAMDADAQAQEAPAEATVGVGASKAREDRD